MSKVSKPKKPSLCFSIQPSSVASGFLGSNVKVARKLNNIEKSKKELIHWLLNCNFKAKSR